MKVEKVSKVMIDRIIETRELRGKFYCKSRSMYVAVDNSNGEAWTEEFKTPGEAIAWLEMTEEEED